jgi:hypothetical protein
MATRISQFRVSRRFAVLFGSNENLIGRPFLKDGRGRLYPRGPENIRALARTIRGCRATVMLSVRPQHEFLESYYLQAVNEGSGETFQQWLARVDFRKLSWRPLVTALHDWFGEENVRVIDFRLIAAGQGSFVGHFLREIGPRFDGAVDFDMPVNRSLSEKGLRLALAAQPFLEHASDRRLMRRFLQRHFSNVDYPRPTLLTDGQRQELAQLYEVEYSQLVDHATGRTREAAP